MSFFPGYRFDSHWFTHPGANGLDQHYVDEGDGPPVLFVHGNPTWSYMWRRPVLALRDRFRCIAPDHIGMGLSDKPGGDRYAHTLAARIDDLDALTTHLITDQGAPATGWTLVMHDWGGPIGMGWAARHPGRVSRLVVLNTAAFPNPHGARVRSALRVPFRVLRGPRLGDRLFLRHNAFLRLATLPPCGVRRPLPRAVRAAYLAPSDQPGGRLAIQRFVQDIPLGPGDPSWPLLCGIGDSLGRFADLPALIAWGRHDPVFDPAFLREWRTRLPGARVRLYPHAGHLVVEDAGDDLLIALRRFMLE
ncbi:alpha/beta fold hydrolase [Actinomadura sp. NAK00032]|uniref:alpha/beta fold hydrolase n=1 Tax=Actinomadura sp. NAK00032 TaxID=2742128 RepID=UPI001591D93A|nr:alpha/beta fold hydrolase [Actinomadura sp. NAK00032]QKW37143.1 alpha/beta fold hydrolase [Actinomadura sp. NAK00032]